jgi:hypothetical protein
MTAGTFAPLALGVRLAAGVGTIDRKIFHLRKKKKCNISRSPDSKTLRAVK